MKITALSLAVLVSRVGAFSVLPSSRSTLASSTRMSAPRRLQSTTLEESDATVMNKTEEEEKKSYLDDGFIFGLEGSGLKRPKGKVANVVVEGDSLETQPYQVVAVSGTFLAHFAFASYAFHSMLDINGGDLGWTSVQALLLTFTSWVLADFGSGVLHWSVDNVSFSSFD